VPETFFSKAVLRVPRIVKTDRSHLLNLSSNELLHPELGPLLEGPLRLLEPASVAAYPAYAGAIRHLAEHHGIEASCLLVSAGSDDAIRLIIEAFAAPRGSMILQVPNYEGWRRHAELRGVQVHEVRFGGDVAERYTMRQFRKFLTAGTPAIVAVSNPNGPTGFTFAPETLAELSAICARQGHLFVIDECYVTFAAPLQRRPLGCANHEIRIQTLSKGYGLAGARIATVIASPGVADYLARFRPENAVSGPAILLASALLDLEEVMTRLRGEITGACAPLVEEVRHLRPHWRPLPTGANFVNFRTGSDAEALAVTRALGARGIRVRNTSGEVGLERCVRVSLAHWSILRRFCEALEACTEVLPDR
jgi:histidinol-phosphate aminotransferase